MLILVRHGETALNENGKERLRGWLPVPLTLKVMHQSWQMAQDFHDVGDIAGLYCSDLVRTVQTATILAITLSKEIQPTMALRDWNTGDLAGKSVQDNLAAIHQHIDQPTKVMLGGESYKAFCDRLDPFLRQLVQGDTVNIAVSHNRVLTRAKALSVGKGKTADMATLKHKAFVEPAGFMVIAADWTIPYMTPADTERD